MKQTLISPSRIVLVIAALALITVPATALEPVIDRLKDEHVVIHDVLDGVDRALVALAADPDAIDGVSAAVDLLTDTLLSHLSYEETELVEPLARYGFYAGQV